MRQVPKPNEVEGNLSRFRIPLLISSFLLALVLIIICGHLITGAFLRKGERKSIVAGSRLKQNSANTNLHQAATAPVIGEVSSVSANAKGHSESPQPQPSQAPEGVVTHEPNGEPQIDKPQIDKPVTSPQPGAPNTEPTPEEPPPPPPAAPEVLPCPPTSGPGDNPGPPGTATLPDGTVEVRDPEPWNLAPSEVP